jgi:hypothetical protein
MISVFRVYGFPGQAIPFISWPFYLILVIDLSLTPLVR